MMLVRRSSIYFLCVYLGFCVNNCKCKDPSIETNDANEYYNSTLLHWKTYKNSLPKKGVIGVCNEKKECTVKGPHTLCLGIFCFCAQDFEFDGAKCHNGRRLEEICLTKQQCQDNDINSICAEEYKLQNRICKCKPGYAQINNQCIKGATIGNSCLNTHHCEVIDPESICFDLKACVCRGGFFFDGIKCRRIAYFNQRCNTTGECQASDQKTHCSFEPGKTTWPTCTCIPGHVFNIAERQCVSVPAEWERLSKVVGILLGLAFLGSGCFLCARRDRTDPELGHCDRGNSHGSNSQLRRSSNRYRTSSRCSRSPHGGPHNADVPRYQYNASSDTRSCNQNVNANRISMEPSSSLEKPPPYEDVIKDGEQAVEIFLDENGHPSISLVPYNNHNTGEGTSQGCNACSMDSTSKYSSVPRPQSV